MKNKFYIELIYLILLGALTSLSLPPFNYFVINFLTFSLFYIFLVKKIEFYKNKKIFFLYGWLFGFGYFVSNLYWISISLTFDQNFKFLIPLTIILIPGFLALFYALVAYLFVFLKPKENQLVHDHLTHTTGADAGGSAGPSIVRRRELFLRRGEVVRGKGGEGSVA